MKRNLLVLVVTAALWGQFQPSQRIDFTAPSPAGPVVTASPFGALGSGTLFYWAVARYPVGFSGVTGPWQALNVNAILSGANGVVLSWPALPGATGYDILRTSTLPGPGGTCTCALVINTATTTVSDTGGALLAYTVANPAPQAQAGIALNNSLFVNPRFVSDRGIQINAGGITFADGTSQTSAAGAPASNLNDPGGNGVVVRNAPTLTVARTLAATAPITVSDGNGVAAAPNYACPTCVTSAAALTSNGVVIGQGGQASAATAAGAANQILRVPGGGGAPAFGSINLGMAAAVGTSTLAVGNGGTGISTATLNGVILGQGGGSAFVVTAAGAANQVLRVGGGGGAPAFGAVDVSQAAAVTGVLARANGGTGSSTLQSRVHAVCTGVASAGVTLFITQYGTATCTNTTESFNQRLLAPSAGTLRNLRALANAAGVNAASGVITLRVNGVDTTVTCTIGVGTSCSDTVNSAAVAAGDRITVSMATFAGETLADVLFSYEY